MAKRLGRSIGKLADTLDKRINEYSAGALTPDFGVIRNDMSLLMNTFPVPIPPADYSVCGSLCGLSISGGSHSGHEGSHTGSHSHTLRTLRPGDRVLVVWACKEPVVVDIIMKARSI